MGKLKDQKFKVETVQTVDIRPSQIEGSRPPFTKESVKHTQKLQNLCEIES